MQFEEDERDPYTILLYYQYVPIENVKETCKYQEGLCQRLNLLGRIRIAAEGINGTLGGVPSDVDAYTQAMDAAVAAVTGQPIHWKRSKLLSGFNREDQKFNNLSVKATKEVVSMDITESEKAILLEAGAANHLTAHEFHNAIDRALQPIAAGEKRMAIIDARNIYETRIGRFDVSSHENAANIQIMDPKTRQFSEFRQYIDSVADELQDKKVLMYCTGGVRCERASAYLLSKGITDVHQLFGGIFQYQQDFPDGGHFKGKNFVYDRRIAVPYPNKSDEVMGACLMCSAPYDDYRPQIRCPSCRMLVLVCDPCRGQLETGGSGTEIGNVASPLGRGVFCENCSARAGLCQSSDLISRNPALAGTFK